MKGQNLNSPQNPPSSLISLQKKDLLSRKSPQNPPNPKKQNIFKQKIPRNEKEKNLNDSQKEQEVAKEKLCGRLSRIISGGLQLFCNWDTESVCEKQNVVFGGAFFAYVLIVGKHLSLSLLGEIHTFHSLFRTIPPQIVHQWIPQH